MSRRLRPRVPAARVVFTVTLADCNSWLLADEVEALRAAVRATRAERPFRIDAWVVLPDHLHAIWTPPETDADYSVRWKDIKARCTGSVGQTGRRRASKIAKGEAGIWQWRFWEHHIRSDEEFSAFIRYCWINPVKHVLVEHPVAWPYSSWHRDGDGDLMP
jgi:putative transposase